VALTATNAQGQPITSGRFAQPITIHVYEPASQPLKALTRTITAPVKKLYFRYSGKKVSNPIVVNAVSGTAFAQLSFQPAGRRSPGKTSVTFPFPNTAANFARGWGFDASVGGGPSHYLQMDTGSTGVVLPASVLGPKAVGPGLPGQIEYTSDGKIFSGNYYLAPLKLSAGGASARTVPIRVLGVSAASCDPNYPDCHVGSITSLGLVGVGFNRGPLGPTPPEQHNAFLALTGIIQSSMDPGYVISANSITLGITAAQRSGFGLIKLQPGGSGPGDWDTEPGCFGFPQLTGFTSFCGTLLMDTGIDSAIVGLPESQRPPSIATSIPNGVSVQFAAPTMPSPSMSYTFTTGSGALPAPTSIRWAAGSQPFVNTGRNLIASYDYLYDGGGGRVGFRPAG
jgi:hypothetical protein